LCITNPIPSADQNHGGNDRLQRIILRGRAGDCDLSGLARLGTIIAVWMFAIRV
jgi:hypothetical protein